MAEGEGEGLAATRRPPSGVTPVFVYGSLMFPSVLQVLLGRIPSARPAVLHGHTRWLVAGQRFPALVKGKGEAEVATSDEAAAKRGETAVRGLLFEDLSEVEAAIFDEFEDDEYDKQLVQPRPADGVDNVWAWVSAGSEAEAQHNESRDSAIPVQAFAYIWTSVEGLDDKLWLASRDFVPHEEEYLDMCGVFIKEELPEELSKASASAGCGLQKVEVSDRKGVDFYSQEATGILDGSGGKAAAVHTLLLVAQGAAIPTAAHVASQLEAKGTARTLRVATGLVQQSQRSRTARLGIYLART